MLFNRSFQALTDAFEGVHVASAAIANKLQREPSVAQSRVRLDGDVVVKSATHTEIKRYDCSVVPSHSQPILLRAQSGA